MTRSGSAVPASIFVLPLLAVGCANENQTRTDPRLDSSSSPAAVQRPPSLTVTRSGSQPPQQGPAEYFTGVVRIDGRFQGTEPARVSGATVTFDPGARTAWHTHPLGQTLVVTAGVGWVQAEGGPVEEVRPGDVVWIPPGVKHWHGATPTSGMSHIAIGEKLDGKSVEWMEKVTDEQYRK